MPRVIVDQGTYKASVKCSVAAAGNASSSQFTFDGSDIIGDSTMVNGNEFVAPVDGMYVVGCQTTTHGSGAVSNFLTVNGANTCWGRGLNPGGLVNLKAGGTVSLSLYGGSSANSGRANIALVNTVADHKVAETMLKPNTWAVGVEQNFGDGVYGLRFKVENSASINIIINLNTVYGVKPTHFIDNGGTLTCDNGATEATFPCYYTVEAFAGLWYNKNTYEAHIVRSKQYSKVTDKFDIWILYRKD